MDEEKLKLVDDKLLLYTPLPQCGDGIYKAQLVMTKEIFKECYKKWIEPQSCQGQQNDVLSKIRAEIEEHRQKCEGLDPYDLMGDCLDIIDKYTEKQNGE